MSANALTPQEIQAIVDKHNKAKARDRKYWIKTELRLKAFEALVKAKKAVDVTDAEVDKKYEEKYGK